MMKNCDKIFELLKKNQVLVAEATDLLHIPYPDPVFRGFQGGCSDGERYYYQALMHYELSDRTKDYSCIAKIDLQTKQIIKYSGILHLDHANDITYHSKRNLLMVTNNKPNFTRITLIDPDSLDVVGYEEAPVPLYALEYNKSRDMLALYGDRLIATHINDNLGVSDYTGEIKPQDDLHLLPFDGVKDWVDFAQRIQKCGYNGALTFELKLASQPGRHENDAYREMPFERYLAEAYKRACRVATLAKNGELLHEKNIE
jgi:hypothetical protein